MPGSVFSILHLVVAALAVDAFHGVALASASGQGAGVHAAAGVGSAAAVPPEWQPRIAESNMFYAPTDVGVRYMPLIGNGYVGTTIGGQDTYLAGVFNGDANITPSHRARLQSNLAVTVTNGAITACALDIERAIYYRRSAVDGAQVEQRWFASRANRSLMVMELEVQLPSGATGVTLKLTTNPGGSSSDLHMVTVAQNATTRVVNGSTILPEDDVSPLHIVSVVSTVVPSEISVKRNATYTFLAAFRSSLDTPRSDTVAAATADYAWGLAHASALSPLHTAAWAQLYRQGGYFIEGRDDVARSVNASLYAILSAVRADFHYSLSPGGLTDGYNGHTFWDCETWMWPNMAVLHPEIAAGLLQYRFDRIPGAQHFARSFSPPYTGNMFVWESAFTGRNVCPRGVGTCTREIHISGDIVVAVRQYWRLTQDSAWLRSTAWPIVSGVADFWVSRSTVDSTTGQASIANVIGPDEYHDHVTNSVYTNSVARISLEFAAEVAKILGEAAKPEWTTLARQLVILFNATGGYHPEYEGYSGATIKQADVILLGFPLDIKFGNMSRAVRLADLDYYGARTSPQGPAMTWGMQAIGYIEGNKPALANSNFNRSFANVQEPFLVWSETPSGGTTNFITGAGGYIQTVLFGWPQLRINQANITFNPLLPNGASAAKIRGFHYLGWSVDIAYDTAGVTLTGAPAAEQLTTNAAAAGSRSALAQLQVVVVATGKVYTLSAAPLWLPLQQLVLTAQ